MAFIYQSFVVAALVAMAACQHGYQYNSFSGPVSGQIRQVQVPAGVAPNHHHHNQQPHSQAYSQDATIDYEAKPDYAFAYGVEDPHSGTTQNHKETRDGDVTRGQYNLLQPDGSVRTVTYTADSKNGFQATVHNTAPTVKQQQYASPVGHVHYQPRQQQQQYQQQQQQQQYNNKNHNNGQYNHNNNHDNGQYNNGQYNGDY